MADDGPERDGPDGPGLLFAYGTLGPRPGDRHPWTADAVRGRLYDLGPYPALVDWDDGAADWVEGHVRATDRRELVGPLDSYEGVDEGLYRRVIAITRSGRAAWVYIYPHPMPPGARGPLRRWGPRPGDPGPAA